MIQEQPALNHFQEFLMGERMSAYIHFWKKPQCSSPEFQGILLPPLPFPSHPQTACCLLDSTAPAEQEAEHAPFTILTLECSETQAGPQQSGPASQGWSVQCCNLSPDRLGSLESMPRWLCSGPMVGQCQHCKLFALQGPSIQMSVKGPQGSFSPRKKNLGEFSQIVWTCVHSLIICWTWSNSGLWRRSRSFFVIVPPGC